MTHVDDPRPCDQLTGLLLDGGWRVESLITPSPSATGGHFSSSYIVARGETRAFLKALDFVEALRSEDPTAGLEELAAAYNLERDILRACGDQKMRNVVQLIADGTVSVPEIGPLGRVSYLIFELADGDIRQFRALSDRLDVAWALRVLHQSALGLRQLHAAGVAHQDLKPSNVLTYEAGSTCKLGDLGRATVQGRPADHDGFAVAGDAKYAPPEALYGYAPSDWDARRRACDLFHLGSLLLFQFTEVNAHGALFCELDRAYWPASVGGSWTGSYPDVVIYLRDALARVADAIPDLGDEATRNSLMTAFFELCDPDPHRRGHPKDHAARNKDSFSLERYVSLFNALAARTERKLVKRVLP